KKGHDNFQPRGTLREQRAECGVFHISYGFRDEVDFLTYGDARWGNYQAKGFPGGFLCQGVLGRSDQSLKRYIGKVKFWLHFWCRSNAQKRSQVSLLAGL